MQVGGLGPVARSAPPRRGSRGFGYRPNRWCIRPVYSRAARAVVDEDDAWHLRFWGLNCCQVAQQVCAPLP
jgi:hypothetical protein